MIEKAGHIIIIIYIILTYPLVIQKQFVMTKMIQCQIEKESKLVKKMLLKLTYSNCLGCCRAAFPKLMESRWKKENCLSFNKRIDGPAIFRLFGFNLGHLGKYSDPLII